MIKSKFVYCFLIGLFFISGNVFASTSIFLDDNLPSRFTDLIKYFKIAGSAQVVSVDKVGFPLLRGWPQPTEEPVTRDIAVANIDGDLTNGLEIFAVSSSADLAEPDHLYGWYADGTSIPGWPKIGQFRAPVFADLDKNNNQLEIIAPKEIVNDSGEKTVKVYAWYLDGTQVPGWPVSTRVEVDIINVPTPTIADLNNDGRTEIIFTTNDPTGCDFIFIWQDDGSLFPHWPKPFCNGTPFASSIGDLDPNFPGLEIVVTDFSARIYAWHLDGTPVSGWPVDVPGLNRGWHSAGSSALADIDGDGLLEVITTASSWDYRYGLVYILHNDGRPMPGWPRTEINGATSAAAVADLDGDHQLEVVVGEGTGYFGAMWIWHADGTVMDGWPQTDYRAYSFSSPAIADINNDGNLEIIGISQNKIYAWYLDGTPVSGWPIIIPSDGLIEGSSDRTPIIVDLNRDGKLELVSGWWAGTFPYTDKSVKVWSLPRTWFPFRSLLSDSAPWPVFHHDQQRTGFYKLFP